MNNAPLVAITGSNGFVGSCLQRHFQSAGWEVLELTRSPAKGARHAPFRLGGEISPDVLTGVTALIHCAYDFQPLNWPELAAVNVGGSTRLFTAARQAGVKQIIYISSISAYVGCRSLYGRAKLAAEQEAVAGGAVVLRPGLVYGDAPGGMFGKLTQTLQKGKFVPLIGDGSQIQFLVHEADLATVALAAANGQPGLAGQIITVAHPEPWPFRRLLSEIAAGLGRHPILIPLPWRFLWLGLKTAETLGLRLNFRSDSLVSLVYQNPQPDFGPLQRSGHACRPFDRKKLALKT